MNTGANGKPATLRDVALHAGVSLATASCALGQGRRGVSDVMRARVQRAADELGYELRPRGRRRARPLWVGVVIPEVTNTFFATLTGAVDEALAAEGHRILVAPSREDPELEDQIVSLLASRIDGLVLAPASQVGPATLALASRGVPVVLVDRDGGAPQLPSVAMDNFDSAYRATMILVESGFERIALVNGPQRISTARARTEGYMAALAAGGLERSDERIWVGEFNFQDARRSVDWLMQAPERPDAIFSTSAVLTSGVLTGLRQHGLRWPDDVAVVGFGDAVYAALVEPGVTVIEQPTRTMGETAARILLNRTSYQQEAPHVLLPSKIVLRDSHWRRARGKPASRRRAQRAPAAAER
ncbi:MAG: LacI family DNA-binding transcriptional regulator [Actinomycetota bacterium]|jgi:LacI family transcriptional regulator|nr:LacI family DNA-binding transcriptional regulator [Actinomycetota bacterium]